MISRGGLTVLPGNGQNEFRARVPFGLVPYPLGRREAPADGGSPASPSDISKLRRASKFGSEPFASMPKLGSEAQASEVLAFLHEAQGRRSEVGQLRRAGLSEAITLAAESAERSPYRGRITGPVKFVNQLLNTWHLNADSACILLGFEPSDSSYIDDVLRGYATLRGRDAKDRITYLFQIRTLLSALFRDDSVENEWLREPQEILNGETPMKLLLEGSMENLLLVKEYVELVAGR